MANALSEVLTLLLSLSVATVEAPEVAQKAAHPSLLSQGAPSTYAIIEVGGHQMFVEPGKWYTCNRLKVQLTYRKGPCFSIMVDADSKAL
eukprot:jgi/Chrzof1/1751/Cz10g19190.t1